MTNKVRHTIQTKYGPMFLTATGLKSVMLHSLHHYRDKTFNDCTDGELLVYRGRVYNVDYLHVHLNEQGLWEAQAERYGWSRWPIKKESGETAPPKTTKDILLACTQAVYDWARVNAETLIAQETTNHLNASDITEYSVRYDLQQHREYREKKVESIQAMLKWLKVNPAEYDIFKLLKVKQGIQTALDQLLEEEKQWASLLISVENYMGYRESNPSKT